MTFDRLEEPIGPRLPELGREGKGAGMRRGGDEMEGEAREGEKKGHTMYRSSWRNCTDDAKMGGTCLEKKTSRAYVSIFTTRQAGRAQRGVSEAKAPQKQFRGAP